MPKIGDLVIFGETDAPQAHCIGRIVGKDGDLWHGQYLSKRTIERYGGPLRDSMITPISDFGVRAAISGKTLTVEQVGGSVARYSDNAPRRWQESLPVQIEII